jgi:hypothetical protein
MHPEHQFHGPVYCETGHPWMGMAEPVNTITNAAIIIAAYLAYRYVRKSKVPMTLDFVVLLFLLTAVGIGSTLWHGLRTNWALQLDWMPGVAFLLVFTALWFRQLFGWAVGILAPIVMFAASIASVVFFWRYFDTLHDVSPNLRFTPAFATITLFAMVMVGATLQKYGKAAATLAMFIVACAIGAAVFRSIDLIVCPYFAVGTHFLWHLLLSTAACLGIVLMVRMKKKTANSE